MANVVQNANGKSKRHELVVDPANPQKLVTRQALRNRRRRARARVNAAIASGRSFRPPPIANNNAQHEQKNNFDDLSPALQRFANAVVHPFGKEAIGAIRPDDYNTVSLPVYDRITMDLDPGLLFAANNPMETLDGYAIVLAPRCLAAGWTHTAAQGAVTVAEVPCISSNGDLTLSEIRNENEGNNYWQMSEQYSLLVMALGTIGGVYNQWAYYSFDNTMRSSPVNRPGASVPKGALNAIRFNRYNQYVDNADGGRIIGAGLKVWSEAAPINTGGTCYGGWITQKDLFGCMAGNTTKGTAGLLDQLAMRQHYRGVDGCTVRYSSCQGPLQQQYATNRINGITINQSANIDLPPATDGSGMYNQDVVLPGDYCPIVIWKFDDNTQANTYSLRVEARCIVQAKPKGSCPFLSILPEYDMELDEVIAILSNPELFPIVAKGYSFKSFWRSLKHAVATTPVKMTRHIQKFIGFAERHGPDILKAVETVGPLIAAMAI